MELENRVTRLETEMDAVESNIAKIEGHLESTAKKEDVKDLKAYFEKRDQHYTEKMWKVIYGLIGALVIIALTAYGIEKIPSFF